MKAETLGELFSNPAFLCIFLAILTTILNIAIGVGLREKDQRQKGLKFHRYVYWTVVCWFALFLWMSRFTQGSPYPKYFVFLYFLVAIPLSRKANVTFHSIIASVGLVLLLVVALLNMM